MDLGLIEALVKILSYQGLSNELKLEAINLCIAAVIGANKKA